MRFWNYDCKYRQDTPFHPQLFTLQFNRSYWFLFTRLAYEDIIYVSHVFMRWRSNRMCGKAEQVLVWRAARLFQTPISLHKQILCPNIQAFFIFFRCYKPGRAAWHLNAMPLATRPPDSFAIDIFSSRNTWMQRLASCIRRFPAENLVSEEKSWNQ